MHLLRLNQVQLITHAEVVSSISLIRVLVLSANISVVQELKPDYTDAKFAFEKGAKSCIEMVDGGTIYVTEDIDSIFNWLI